jgi:hypothetical protein
MKQHLNKMDESRTLKPEILLCTDTLPSSHSRVEDLSPRPKIDRLNQSVPTLLLVGAVGSDRYLDVLWLGRRACRRPPYWLSAPTSPTAQPFEARGKIYVSRHRDFIYGILSRNDTAGQLPERQAASKPGNQSSRYGRHIEPGKGRQPGEEYRTRYGKRTVGTLYRPTYLLPKRHADCREAQAREEPQP